MTSRRCAPGSLSLLSDEYVCLTSYLRRQRQRESDLYASVDEVAMAVERLQPLDDLDNAYNGHSLAMILDKVSLDMYILIHT